MRLWHRQHHALLRFGKPDLPGLQASILQRHIIQHHRRTALGPHLAHRRREAARATIGNRAIQARVARLQQHIEHFLLGNRVADLHGTAHFTGSSVRQLSRRERCTVNTITASAPAQHNNRVAGPCVVRVAAARCQAYRAAKHQRVRGVTRVVQHRAIDGGNSQLVAIIAHPGYYARGHALRVQHAGRKLGFGEGQRPKAQDIGVGNWQRRHAQHIAHHAAHTSVCAAKRFERRGVVMGFDFNRHFVSVAKGQNARVIHEGREDEWA